MDEMLLEYILRISSVLGGVIIVAVIIFVIGGLKKEKQRTIQKMLEQGQFSQEQLARLISPKPQHEIDFRRGVLLIGLGFTTGAAFLMIGGIAWIFGAIPIVAGFISLLFWRLNAPKNEAETGEPALIRSAVLHNDHAAFEGLVKLHQSPVRLFLRKLTSGDASLADDLAQETFIKAHRHLASYRGEGRFLSWLFKIAYQQFAQHLRRRPRQTHLVLEDTESPQVSHQRQVESRIRVRQMLARLGTEERAAIVLHYQYGLTHPQIADTMALPLGTVKSHIRRGKEKLRQQEAATHKEALS